MWSDGHRTPRAKRPWTPFTAGLAVVMTLLLLVIIGRLVVVYLGSRTGYDADRDYPTPEIEDGGGSFAFSALQADGRTPVTYDPCQPIRLQINPENAPPDHRKLVERAVVHTSEATGFEFDILGTTDSRKVGQPLDQDAAPPPVLVMWADEHEFGALAGGTAGVAGSTKLTVSPSFSRYITGFVVLDRVNFDQMAELHADEPAQAIVDHEFGHLVGLSHVKDSGELMHEENVGQTSYGPGDREGLARLGNVACH
ncbi:hypothetical protein [Nocardioides cavernaquae]|uniref:Matrixin family metalloprotease n=1 Tax=Nocardioides cavernaquae TaxID=2321396 RepID=A0A3A5H716_9ACTN|nr:hypothetical protein [Nocardioides cavernaquae]RJS46469.1 hypothetical protein D4739_09770 [Nocardioides cavernaquae]